MYIYICTHYNNSIQNMCALLCIEGPRPGAPEQSYEWRNNDIHVDVVFLFFSII